MFLSLLIKKIKYLSVITLLLLGCVVSHAQEISEAWTSVRALGMGNSYSAVVDNADSLFYNPAGIARGTGFRWTIMDPKVGLNGPQTIKNLGSVAGAGGNLAKSVAPLYGDEMWAGGSAKTAITAPFFAAAAYVSTDAGIFVTNPANTTMDLNYFFDYGIAVGTGFDLIPGFVKWGFVGRRINRTGTTVPVGPGTLATMDTTSLQSQLKSRGVGYGLDSGMLITVPGPVSPSLSIVYKNIGETTFTHDEGAAAPAPIQDEIDVGGALAIKLPLISITPSFDYKYLNRTDIQLGKKLHLGVELGLPLIDLRAGFNQGYYTAGVGLDLLLMRVDVATFGVEMGVYPGQLEDRRYVVQFTFDLGFDPGSFGGGGSGGGSGPNGTGGSRHHLIQRR